MARYDIPVIKIEDGQQSSQQIKDRLIVIDKIIIALENSILTSSEAGDVGIVEYEIHTGQTKQKVRHTEADSMINSLLKWQKYRDFLAVKLSPRNVRLVKSKNFSNNC